ncbi:MAG: hypothetical protein EOM93_07600 [Gammaproteobacteria bacterium]|nr:hypothetical protein [Gammaproteobacteria bacterium]
MDEHDLEDIKQRLTKVEAQNEREWDILKSYFPGNHADSKRPSLPKAKLSKRSWALIIIWQIVGSIFKWVPIDELFF